MLHVSNRLRVTQHERQHKPRPRCPHLSRFYELPTLNKSDQRVRGQAIGGFQKVCFENVGHLRGEAFNRIQTTDISCTIRVYSLWLHHVIRPAVFAQAIIQPSPLIEVEAWNVVVFLIEVAHYNPRQVDFGVPDRSRSQAMASRPKEPQGPRTTLDMRCRPIIRTVEDAKIMHAQLTDSAARTAAWLQRFNGDP